MDGITSRFERWSRALALALAAGVLSSCGAHGETQQSASRTPRIVALAPSIADDCIAIGAGKQLVGVSQFSAAPSSVARVADFRTVDTERIVALRPGVVIGIDAQARSLEPLRRAGVRVVLLKDDSYDEIFANIHTVGALSGHAAQAEALVRKLQGETAQLQARTQHFRRHPRVFVTLGTGPIWTAGSSSYIGRLLQLAGAADAANIAQPWGEYSEEALLRAQPDAIVSDDETNLRAVQNREPWRSLTAVREGNVFVVTDPRVVNALFRPGPHYNEGLRWLIERLTPLAM